jgi:MoaA/NifB/PqqE/SkfB family radical SAM enzyme
MCNLHCPICPTGLGIIGRKQGRIDADTFYAIIDSISRYAYILEIGNWGESFLHPDIFDMITYAHNHHLAVKVISNLNYFDREMAESAVDSGLDYVMISIDGITQEVYERYHIGGNLSKVFDNIKLLVEARERKGDFFSIYFYTYVGASA